MEYLSLFVKSIFVDNMIFASLGSAYFRYHDLAKIEEEEKKLKGIMDCRMSIPITITMTIVLPVVCLL